MRRSTFAVVVILVSGAAVGVVQARPGRVSPAGLTGAGAQGEACTPASIVQRPGAWKENPPDLAFAANVAPRARHAALLKRIAPMAAMFRDAYPEPRGTAAEGYASIRPYGDEIEGGPYRYGYDSLYKTWLCPKSTGRASLADETGNWAHVHVNSLDRLLSEVGELEFDGGRHRVWMLAPAIGELRGQPLYRAWLGFGDGRALLFTRRGRVPWAPVSRRQYLDGLARYWQQQADEAAGRMDELERNLAGQIEEIRKTMTGQARDTMVAELERGLAQAREQKTQQQARLAANLAGQLQTVSRYRAAHPGEMDRPAVLPEGLRRAFTGEFTDGTEDGRMLVVVDPSYFQSGLPPDEPQIVALLWRWEKESPAAVAWKTAFEQRFPLDKLEALLAR
ncbi:MAG: hypothetical protein R2752_15775 [Vicinamibacterales bacterium]